MAKRATGLLNWKPPGINGRVFVLAGSVQAWGVDRKDVEAWIKSSGGRVAKSLSRNVDVLVAFAAGSTTSARLKAGQLKQKKPSIQIMEEDDFFLLFQPPDDVLAALLKAGRRKRVQDLVAWSRTGYREDHEPFTYDLSGADLRGANFSDLFLYSAQLDGADLRDARLTDASLGVLTSVRLEKAQCRNVTISGLVNCRCANANLTIAGIGDHGVAPITDCDMTGVLLNGATLSECDLRGSVFKKADLSRANLSQANAAEVDFTGACLKNAELEGASLQRANLTRCDLSKANLINADLSGAILKNANLTGANLGGATLTDAVINGASFKGANLGDATTTGIDPAKAKDLDLPAAAVTKPGSNCRRLAAAEKQARKVSISATVTIPSSSVHLGYSGGSGWRHAVIQVTTGNRVESDWIKPKTIQDGLVEFGKRYGHGELNLQSIEASGSKCPLKGKELKEVVIGAWCEVFGVDAPSPDQLKKKAATRRKSLAKLADEALEELRSEGGVARWNARKLDSLKSLKGFRKADLSGLKLDKWCADGCDFSEANFSGTSLREASLRGGKLTGADLTHADLRKSAIRNTSLKDAACEKANLTGADLEWSSLRGANFRDANLSQASLAYCDLRGANLSGTKTRKTHFIDNEFDEQTRFPDGFEITDAFHWKGRGVDPRTAVSPPPVPTGPLDFDQFMQQLALTVDSSRLKKSLKMLKADSFELFSKVDEEGFVGVVKSQSDVDLVYSCRLTSDGEFSCCTQNLNPCGGLRGALCKHLLVLIIGLTKCRELDPTMASGWAQASLHKKPALDRDAMSETLLRYKGAEAGEIDWRPVETVPEDYYAF